MSSQLSRSSFIFLCLFAIFSIAYRSALVQAKQTPEPTPSRVVFYIEPDKVLLEVGETTQVKVSLHTAEGCNYGSGHFVFKAVDENGEESDFLQRVDRDYWPVYPVSVSIWEAKKPGQVRLTAYSFGEGACQPDPSTPAPFFNASAGGSSQEILIVDQVYHTFIPTITIEQ